MHVLTIDRLSQIILPDSVGIEKPGRIVTGLAFPFIWLFAESDFLLFPFRNVWKVNAIISI